MKVLIDVNLSPAWVDFLRRDGVDAVHWSAIGESDAPDVEILAYAHRFHCAVLTQDLDFGAILSATKAPWPSVVQIRAGRVHPSSLGVQVLAALRELERETDSGSFVTIERNRTRLRRLPFSTCRDSSIRPQRISFGLVLTTAAWLEIRGSSVGGCADVEFSVSV